MSADQAAHDVATVGVLGFSDFERIALETVFKLGERRQPGFQRHDAGTGRPATLWLVDGDVPSVLDAFRVLTRGRPQLAIFVGAARPPEAELFLEKPLRWSTALSTIETALALRAALPIAEPAAAVAEAPPSRSTAEAVAAPAAPVASVAPASGEITIHLPDAPVSTNMRPSVAVRPEDNVARSRESVASSHGAIPRPAQASDSARESRRRPVEPPPSRRVPATNVLVVDDSEFTREFMRRALARLDVALHFADSGEAAIGMSVEREYALIFLDVVMSGIDGYQVCKTLKAKRRAGAKAPPVVMLTSKGSPFDRVRGTFAGCDAYLVKPVDETRLMQIVARFLPATVTSPAASALPGRPAFR